MPLVLSTALTLLVGLTVSGWYSYITSKQLLLDGAILTLKESMERQSNRIQYSIDSIVKDARLIAQLDEVQGLIHTLAGEADSENDVNRWQYEVEHTFGTILKTKDYLQIRVISVESGKEVVRVDRNESVIVTVEEEALQFKGGKQYFIEGKKLKGLNVYISPITLNREYGVIQKPWIPTQRFVVPIYRSSDDEKHFFGLVVINVDAKKLISQLDESDIFKMAMVNASGGILSHTDDSLEWGFEFGLNNGFDVQHPKVWGDALAGNESLHFDDIHDALHIIKRIFIGENKSSFIGVIMEVEYKNIQQKANSLRNSIIIISIFIVLIGVIFSAVIILTLTRPLGILKKQVSKALEDDSEISISGSREINELVNAFVILLTKVRDRHDDVVTYNKKIEVMNNTLSDRVRMVTQDLSQSVGDEKLVSNLLARALEDTGQVEYLKSTIFYLFDNVFWLSKCRQSFVFLRDDLKGKFDILMVMDEVASRISMPKEIPLSNEWMQAMLTEDCAYYDMQIPCLLEDKDAIFGGYIIPILQSDRIIGFVCILLDEEVEGDGKSIQLLDRVGHVLGVGVSRRINEKQMLLAKDAAERANAAKNEFLSIMSHEIRTPMNSIIGFTKRVLNNGDNLTDRQEGALTMVSDSADSLLEIINDILDYSKMEAGKLGLEEYPFLLLDMLRSQMLAFSDRANEKGVVLRLEIGMLDVETIRADKLRMTQVLGNFLSNAIKFTEKGEVVLSVKSDGDNTLIFSVKDSGVGIRQGKIKEIFEPFTQGESFETRKHGGTGLGLAVCHKLAQLMGGKVWVESEEGKGSIFYFSVDLNVSGEDTSK
ncbi:hypothetical protein A9Q81_27965 [Gammaproteobacteria bacterium 42_54_T18]|nr:hypothetical protein A9Q81_27965 [Gammaproteobacteria bacterium 42_54_T18]